MIADVQSRQSYRARASMTKCDIERTFDGFIKQRYTQSAPSDASSVGCRSGLEPL
jgi:hypothetical protein